MKLYFSGLNREADVALLVEAGVQHALVDPHDLRYAQDWPGELALDSGAYRVFRGHADPMFLFEYIRLANSREFAFVVQPDVINDEAQTRRNYFAVRSSITANPLMPVWPWGGSDRWLRTCLDLAPIVGVGGLVAGLRSKIGKVQKTKAQLVERFNLELKLHALCRQYPDRLHLFGLNHLVAWTWLWPWAASCDTSKWLDARRYGDLIFLHSRYDTLSQAPARVLPHNESFAGREPDKTRRRLILSAQALYSFRPPEGYKDGTYIPRPR